MPLVALDPHLLALPQDASLAAVESFAKSLADWAALLDKDWVDLHVSEAVGDALIESGQYPFFDNLRQYVRDCGTNVIDAGTLASLTQSLLHCTPIEARFGIADISWSGVVETLTPDPPVALVLSNALLRTALILLTQTELESDHIIAVSSRCRGRQWTNLTYESVDVLTQAVLNSLGNVTGRIYAALTVEDFLAVLTGNIASGQDLWDRRNELFPNLSFSPEIEAALAAVTRQDLLDQVIRKLKALDTVASDWQTGAFPRALLSFGVGGESEATMNKYGGQRDFHCADGVVRRMETHARLTPGSWRLYFWERKIDGRLPIGYIGPHLEIVSVD